jgi:hypothetical protein
VEGAKPQETIGICLNALDECAGANNGNPFFLFLGGERYGWVPSPEDVGPELAARYEWVQGASVTAMELMHGALRCRNPNAIFCLRDPSFAHAMVRQKPDCAADFVGESGSSECCSILRDLINNNMSSNQVIHYNPLSSASSMEPNWSDFIQRVTSAVRGCVEQEYPLLPAPPPGNADWYKSTCFNGTKVQILTQLVLPPGLPAMRRHHALVANALARETVPRATILAALIDAVECATDPVAGCGRRLIVVGAESGRFSSTVVQICCSSVAALLC